MLGSQSWALSLSIPAFLFGGFVASRKRLAYQWREELMDMDGDTYSSVCDEDMRHFRRVAPRQEFVMRRAHPHHRSSSSSSSNASSPADNNRANDDTHATPCMATSAATHSGTTLTQKDNIGLFVLRDAIAPESGAVLLTEIRRLADTIGSALDARKMQSFRWRAEIHARSSEGDGGEARRDHTTGSKTDCTGAKDESNRCLPEHAPAAEKGCGDVQGNTVDVSFYEHIRVVSDHAEDIQAMHAPWGCGDKLELRNMPSYLRLLVAQMQQHFHNVGRLRHVYIEYSPTGRFFREPRAPCGYDGHDYVLLALRRDGASTVITLSPNTRSRYPRLDEVRRYSWTSYDVDALLPAQSVLHVYGSARYDYGWGVRPGRTWFGSWHNPVLDESSACLTATRARCHVAQASTHSAWRKLCRLLSPLQLRSRAWHSRAKSTCDGDTLASSGSGCSNELSLRHEAALVVLHFEGPRSQKKQRSLLLHPEAFIFGRVPTPEVFETWVNDTPTPKSVRDEGLIRFIVRNYANMWCTS